MIKYKNVVFNEVFHFFIVNLVTAVMTFKEFEQKKIAEALRTKYNNNKYHPTFWGVFKYAA